MDEVQEQVDADQWERERQEAQQAAHDQLAAEVCVRERGEGRGRVKERGGGGRLILLWGFDGKAELPLRTSQML